MKYTSFTDTGTGFNKDVLEKFLDDIKYDSLKEYDKNVSLLFDEMHIKAGLVYNRSSGRIIGFTDLGEINTELDKFGSKIKNIDKEESSPDIATHVLAFMARGMFKRFNYPIAYFASRGYDSDQLYPIVWESVRVLESLGLQVRAFVCDGASPNRKFFKMHQMAENENCSDDGVVYWTYNRYRKGERIYFFSDTPHLIKTVRNNIENSHAHNNTRQLMVRF